MRNRVLAALALALLCPAANAGPLPTVAGSGSVTTGGTFQTLRTLDQVRSAVEFQNLCSVSGNCVATTDNCYLFFGSGTATKPTSIVVSPGQEYLRSSGAIPYDAVQVTCDGTGDKFYFAVQ